MGDLKKLDKNVYVISNSFILRNIRDVPNKWMVIPRIFRYIKIWFLTFWDTLQFIRDKNNMIVNI